MIFGTIEKWGEDGHALKGNGTGIQNAIEVGFDTFDTAPGYLNEKENHIMQSHFQTMWWG